jgi:hypothetical protein
VYTIIGIKCFYFRYSTASSNGQPVGNFLKKLNMPNDQVLDIIGLDTWFLQVLSHKIKNIMLYMLTCIDSHICHFF